MSVNPHILPADLGLPQRSWRPLQWETIIAGAAALEEKKYLLIEAPPGAGKSVIALAIARLRDAAHTHLLTQTKQLQDQYVESFPGIVKVIGRNNFDCEIDVVRADDAPCTWGQSCPMAGEHGLPGCGYYDQKRIAWQADTVTMNYSYWLPEMNYVGSFPRPDLLVCDEAHLLDEALLGFATLKLTVRSLAVVDLVMPPMDTPLEVWRGWAQRTAWKLEARLPELEDVRVAKSAWGRALKSVHTTCEQLGQIRPVDWVALPGKQQIEFKPIWADTVAQRSLFRHADKVLCISATLGPKRHLCDLLGIDPSEAAMLTVPSVFEPSSRPLHYRPVGKVTREHMADVLPRLIEAVDEILEEHPHQRGLIHTVSYELADALARHSRHGSRLIVHDAKTRGAALETFKQATSMVLVSPSMTTGVDLPYDLLRFQVVAKLPFPYLGDPQIKARMATTRGQEWYPWMTKNVLIQAYGRIMRSEDDYGTTYLLDGTWDWFRQQNRALIPDWVREAIQREQPKMLGSVGV